jgi:hypothetical protein
LIALRGAQSFSAPPAPASFLLLKSEIKMSLIRSFINRTSLGARGGEFYGNPFRDSAGRDVDAFFFFVWTRHHRSFSSRGRCGVGRKVRPLIYCQYQNILL